MKSGYSVIEIVGYTHVVMIIGSLIGISYYWPLFGLVLKDVTNIIMSVLIMSFLVIIASLSTFTVLIIIQNYAHFRIRNQKVHCTCRWNIGSVSVYTCTCIYITVKWWVFQIYHIVPTYPSLDWWLGTILNYRFLDNNFWWSLHLHRLNVLVFWFLSYY